MFMRPLYRVNAFCCNQHWIVQRLFVFRNVKNCDRRCQTLRRRVQSRVLLSEAKMWVRIEMSPGRSATFMTDYWRSVSQWDDVWCDDKTSNDNWAIDFDEDVFCLHKIRQLWFDRKESKLLLLLLLCCCNNPFFSLVCQVFTFLLLVMPLKWVPLPLFLNEWQIGRLLKCTRGCVQILSREKNLMWKSESKKKLFLTNNKTFQGHICFVLLVLRGGAF